MQIFQNNKTTDLVQNSTKLSALEAMKLAIDEAYKGVYFVSPNPLVGCVILNKEGYFLSKGYHEKFGGPHAEINALNSLSLEQLKGAQVFVTLEPCAHEGKTPSCAKALAKLPIQKVCFGITDPNPLVSGKGVQILREAGIEVEEFPSYTPEEIEIKNQLEEVCEVFLWNFRKKSIFIGMKVATSLDGQMGFVSGESKWITNLDSRTFGHGLRAQYDATLVGARTVAIDDPQLNIRNLQFNKDNKVVVIDFNGSLLHRNLKLFQSHKPENIYWIIDNELNINDDRVTFVRIQDRDVFSIVSELYKLGIRSLLIEGGAKTYGQFFSAGLVQRIHLFQAPILMGAQHGLSWSSHFGGASMLDKIQISRTKVQILGDTVYITGRL